jgi:uncharacterized membrane protein
MITDHNGNVTENADVQRSTETPAEEPHEEVAAGRADPSAIVHHLRQLERLLEPERRLLMEAEANIVLPAWRRVTRGEPRWPVSIAVLGSIALQLALPAHLTLATRWLLPGAETLMLVGLISLNPHRINRRSPALRAATIFLIAVASLANAWSAGALVTDIVRGLATKDAARLLLTGAAIWLTNVIVFALWYWELDRGGPAARANALKPHPDLLFPQMQSPELAPPEWQSEFVDYFYLSFTNATAFSPTDVLPLSHWAKLTMMLQSAVSLATVALVVARAVNVLQ